MAGGENPVKTILYALGAYRIIIIVITLIFSSAAAADSQQNKELFETIFSQWTQSFNHKDLAGSCSLFSTSLVADYQGTQQKSYASICDGFKKIFQQQERQYQYQFKLHDIYRDGNLAAVRITWYLSIYRNKKLISYVQDEGLDIFIKNQDGGWKIINYLGYPVR